MRGKAGAASGMPHAHAQQRLRGDSGAPSLYVLRCEPSPHCYRCRRR